MSNAMIISLVVRVAVIIALGFLHRIMIVMRAGKPSIQTVLDIFIGTAQTAIFIWLVVDVVRLIRA